MHTYLCSWWCSPLCQSRVAQTSASSLVAILLRPHWEDSHLFSQTTLPHLDAAHSEAGLECREDLGRGGVEGKENTIGYVIPVVCKIISQERKSNVFFLIPTQIWKHLPIVHDDGGEFGSNSISTLFLYMYIFLHRSNNKCEV